MIILSSIQPQRRRRAFTLVEVLITMVTVMIVLGGAMGAYIYGLKMVQLVQPKLTASEDARRVMARLTEDIRSANDVKIGNRTNGEFAVVSPFSLQSGNALRIYPTTNTNSFVFYFWDANDSALKRTTNNATFTDVVAASVTNSTVFTGEDFYGRVLTNDNNNHVIGLTLQFYQLTYPKVAVGAGNYFDWYQLRCKVTKRTLF